jgi:hypothetical protein
VKSSPFSISTHTNLVLALTNTHYKPSLCCLEFIFPRITYSPPPSRYSQYIYRVQRGCMVKYFQQLESRVAITTDMWTTNHQKKGYMSVTSHYIDEKWNLKSFLLR